MFRPNNPLLDYAAVNERIDLELALRARRRQQSPPAAISSQAPVSDPAKEVPDPTKEESEPAAARTPARVRIRAALTKIPIVGALPGLWTRRHAEGRAFRQLLGQRLRVGERVLRSRTLAPLLFDPAQAPLDAPSDPRFAGKRTLLFVGSWQEAKGQPELVRVFALLKEMSECPVQLVLAGKSGPLDYIEQVQSEIARHGLQDDVLIVADATAQDLEGFYQSAELFISLSNIESLSSALRDGMPLVRAMTNDLPVVAFHPGVVSYILGGGGVLLESIDPDRLAAFCKLVLEEPWLRRQLIRGQRIELGRFERRSVAAWLRRTCNTLKYAIGRKGATDARYVSGGWRIEGPFDSSYSLAIVNREVAAALAQKGEDVALVSRDGPAPFPPNPEFLRGNPAVQEMWARGLRQQRADVALRNMYPPLVFDLKGELRGLVCYAWEESEFPQQYVRELNRKLDLITVTSRFVAKTLRDNGVRTPIHVVGDGIDQITRLEVTPEFVGEICRKHAIGTGLCFLHISSCMPRKGVDLLLSAWAKVFRADDDVVLVLKTIKNAYHDLRRDVAALLEADKECARIVVIDEDVDRDQIRALYERCDVVVAPSRGEGFGLPIAEALALGKPVITTGFGGQMDFCSTEDAWLCDYDFDYARSHLSTGNSVWVEPRLDSLVASLEQARDASSDERLQRGRVGRERLETNFRWENVAARLHRAVADVSSLDSRVLKLPKVGWVSTWNSRCGIADYSKSLTKSFPPNKLAVFANWNAELVGPDLVGIRRCWEQGWGDPLDRLFDEILEGQVDAVVVQFNFGFFDLKALSRLVDRLSEKRIAVYLSLHSTNDIERPDLVIRLADALPSLSRARRVLVHSVDDLNRLKQLGAAENAAIVPFGLPFSPERRSGAKAGEKSKKLIATFGYLLAHKGLPELIEALAIMRAEGVDAELLMLNALYPAVESEQVKKVCEEAISRHGLQDHVQMRTEYLGESEVLEALARADLVVFPYQSTQESASAAVRLGLASLTPVATTPLPIFKDIAAITHRLPGGAPGEIAAAVQSLFADPGALMRFAPEQAAWVSTHRWEAISQRVYDLIRGDAVDCIADDSQPSV